MGAIANSTHSLAANVTQAGTFTVPYPAGTNQALLTGTTGGVIVDQTTQAVYKQGAGGFTAAFGASNITITNDSGQTWNAASVLGLSFGRTDINGSYNLTFPKQVQDKVAALPAE